MTEAHSENPAGQSGATAEASGQMAEALESVKAASPQLADAIAAAGITPEELADARARAAAGGTAAGGPADSGQQPADA